MSEQLVYATKDAGGGLVDGSSLPATVIPPRLWSRLVNFYTHGTYIKRREGMARVTTSAYSEQLTGLYAMKVSAGAWVLLAGGLTTLARLTGTVLSALTKLDAGTLTSQVWPWTFRQMADIVYAARRDTGTIKRILGGSFHDAGIAAPTGAPTLADGGAGALPAATYYGVYRYRNSATGAKSNWGPVSGALALGASKKINWSGLVASTNPQVDTIDLGRTLGDQTGEYFLVASVANTATTYTGDQVLNADLGDMLEDTHGLPPADVRVLEVFADRLWASTGTGVEHSELGLPESWNRPTNYLPIFDEDGHEVRALLAIPGQLVVGKTNAIRYVAGIDSFEVGTITPRHGVVAGESLRYALGQLIWYAGDNFYAWGGGDPRPLADKRIRALLDRIPDARKQFVSATVYPRLNWYVASLPVDGGTDNSVEVVYNYHDDTWATFERSGGKTPRVYGDFWSSDYEHLMYGALYDNHVYDLASGTTDQGAAIVAVAETGELGLEQDGQLKGCKRVNLLAPSLAGETVTLKAYRDESTTPHKTRAGLSLALAGAWKRYSLSTLNRLAKTFRIGIEYSGTQPLRIDGWQVEAVSTSRRGRAA